MPVIVQNIVFPLMCYTDEDEELWTTDPHEYIRMKFDVFEDYVSPVTAAQTLLHTCCKKRKDMLAKSMAFCIQVLNSPSSDPRMKDGALHMVGAVADILLKKDTYKDQMENMITTYVFPHFQSPHGYLRARACWVLNHFEDIRFQNDTNLVQALGFLQTCLLNDQELPVKVEAAISLQYIVSNSEKAQRITEPNITQVALEMLKIIRETENEDLANVMQKIVCIYSEQLAPIAVEMTQHLAQTFSQILSSGDDDEGEDKALTAMGVLNTIDTVITMMEDQKEIMMKLEPIVTQIVVAIFNQELMELYEEAFTLITTITTNFVSPEMWKLFEMMYEVFNKDGFDYFTDMMPSLHNFITVDPAAFISNQNHLLAIFSMCKAILTNDNAGEEAECHAVKLLEVVILQFKGQIDQCIPSLVELALTRALTREVKTDDLRTMCIQVVIAALYYNPQLLFQILDKMQPPNSNQSLVTHFISQWIQDTHCFLGLHDRKMCVLGLCTLMSLPPNQRPAIINEIAPQIVPSALLLFEGLKEAYKSKAENELDSDSGSEETDDDASEDIQDLDDDEDHQRGSEYYRKLLVKINNNSPFPVTSAQIMDDDDEEDEDDDDSDEDDEFELTALESYTTAIDDEDAPDDEYVIFKELIEKIQAADPNWYNVLASQLNAQQHKSIQDIYTLALQRKAAAGKSIDFYSCILQLFP